MFHLAAELQGRMPEFGVVLAMAVMMLSTERRRSARAMPVIPLVRTMNMSVPSIGKGSACDRPHGPRIRPQRRRRRQGDLKVEPATTPMRIAIIVDDSGTGIFRVPVANFVNQLLGHEE